MRLKSKVVKVILIIILVLIIIALLNFMIFAIINKDNESNMNFSLLTFGDTTEKIFEKEYESEELDKIKVDVYLLNVSIEKEDVDICSKLTIEEVEKLLNGTVFDVKVKSKTLGSLIISYKDKKYEYTTFRKDIYPTGGQHLPEKVIFIESQVIMIITKRIICIDSCCFFKQVFKFSLKIFFT